MLDRLLDRRTLILLAAGGSLAMLLAAWGFQYFGGLAPCKLCIWQRWPHGAAVVLGILALGPALVILPLLGAAAAAATAGVGLYQTGMERGWWEGSSSCASGSIEGLTPDELMAQILAAPVVRCDEVVWELFGLSMASWNSVVSLGFMGLWLLAALRTRAGAA